MSKNTVKLIWLWVIGLSFIFSISVVLILRFENTYNPCNQNHPGHVSFLAQRVYAQIPQPPDSVGQFTIDSCMGYHYFSFTDFLMFGLEIFSFIMLIGSILMIIFELIYLFYAKIKHLSDYNFSYRNILISLINIFLLFLIYYLFLASWLQQSVRI
jgi:hypothetical protein